MTDEPSVRSTAGAVARTVLVLLGAVLVTAGLLGAGYVLVMPVVGTLVWHLTGSSVGSVPTATYEATAYGGYLALVGGAVLLVVGATIPGSYPGPSVPRFEFSHSRRAYALAGVAVLLWHSTLGEAFQAFVANVSAGPLARIGGPHDVVGPLYIDGFVPLTVGLGLVGTAVVPTVVDGSWPSVHGDAKNRRTPTSGLLRYFVGPWGTAAGGLLLVVGVATVVWPPPAPEYGDQLVRAPAMVTPDLPLLVGSGLVVGGALYSTWGHRLFPAASVERGLALVGCVTLVAGPLLGSVPALFFGDVYVLNYDRYLGWNRVMSDAATVAVLLFGLALMLRGWTVVRRPSGSEEPRETNA